MPSSKSIPSLARAVWLKDPALQKLLKKLEQAGGEARVVGGAVRNALLKLPVDEIDVATTLLPEEVAKACTRAGFGVHPTGIDHGTLTITVGGKPFEVTTLRRDVETDGRRAVVAYSRDWAEDAMRRDFTMNALYADAQGKIYDYTDGYGDILNHHIRFVGKPADRIREDYLRILRFFRFHARFGGKTMDRLGLAACARHKAGLKKLSAERIRMELLKLLEASAAVPTLKIMAKHGILSVVLPHANSWHVIERLPADGTLRLSVLASEGEGLKTRLKLSNEQAKRLEVIGELPALSTKLRMNERRRILYQLRESAWSDAVHLSWARSRASLKDRKWKALLDLPRRWRPPAFPVNGGHLIARGIEPGPQIGQTLRQLEDWWIASDFTLDRDSLLTRVKN
jgi:poly(A) polymerase